MDLTLDPEAIVDAKPAAAKHWNKAALVAYLQPRVSGVDASLQMTKIEGGQSNPSWILKCKNKSWVLRAKPAPASQLMPSAHAIEREFRILLALQHTSVSVPRVRVLCEDESILGVAFYVMDYVEGRIFRDATLPEVPTAERRAYFEAASNVLSQLHQVDWRRLGLSDFGRHEGYYTRLIKRWTQQYTAARLAPVDAMDKLAAWLPLNIPEGADSAHDTVITHGDYRIENLMFHPTRPEVVAVLDWELCTLGHPLSDLSYSTLAWHMPSGVLRGYCDQDWQSLGLPSEQEFIAHYAQAFQLDTARLRQEWPFYLAFNFFRLSAILEGIGQRERAGMASSSTAKEIAAMAQGVAKCGWAIAQGQAPRWDV
ncbi:phosphotransferase family protein [Limnohabitans sp. Hippo4]|uniref:phosphotransferase family protein n=1 Tax=Limnohabitans sp. Hippo4 TaxID=1826167 RepID=UPI000D39A6E4|nr:phosphotransferase family protein [Limnohabitans sp. Hippo4]PUE37870.1 hypothetical protein B9Z46_04105 [Limnohabitans sp. Hippo4]